MDEHVKAYARHLGYKLENHPPFLTITELLARREEVRRRHREWLEQWRPKPSPTEEGGAT